MVAERGHRETCLGGNVRQSLSVDHQEEVDIYQNKNCATVGTANAPVVLQTHLPRNKGQNHSEHRSKTKKNGLKWLVFSFVLEIVIITGLFVAVFMVSKTAADDQNSKASSVLMDLERKLKAGGCPLTNLTFPRDGEVEDYVLYNGSTVPQLINVSICTWLTSPTGRDIGRGAVLSYYKYDINNKGGDTMLIHFMSENSLSIVTHGIWSDFFLDNQPVRNRTHFCFLFSTVEGTREIFRNGISLGQRNIPNIAAIPAGGALVIGSDQNRVADPDTFLGSMTKPLNTFAGTIENLYIWSLILSEDEIGELYNNPCACPRDHIIALTDANVETHGQTQASSIRNACV